MINSGYISYAVKGGGAMPFPKYFSSSSERRTTMENGLFEKYIAMLHSHKRKSIRRSVICIIMVISVLLTGFIVARPAGAVSQPTTSANRIADPSTLDDYKDILDFSSSARYAGRIWSDKSVFAYDSADIGDRASLWKDNVLKLTDELDGYNGNIELDSDFLTVYSALGSSEEINETVSAPIDLVILIDMSGSMAMDLDQSHTHDTSSAEGKAQHLAHSRIQSVLDSTNAAIKMLMEDNPENKVAVIGYAGTAATLMPLDHYSSSTGTFLTASELSYYSTVETTSVGSGAYTITVNAQKGAPGKQTTFTKAVRNNYLVNSSRDGHSGSPQMIGYSTNMQAGIIEAFNELYDNAKQPSDVTYTYHSSLTNKDTTIARIPVAFVMTDGGSNLTLTGEAGNEYYKLSCPEQMQNYIYGRYRSETNGSTGGAAMLMDILLSASFMKSKVLNQYTTLLRRAGVLRSNEKAVFPIHSISVDTNGLPDWQIPRIYAGVDPKEYFNATANGATWAKVEDVKNAYSMWTQWKNGTVPSFSFTDDDKKAITARYNRLPEGGYQGVTNQDIIDNILYNDTFSNIAAADLTGIFEDLLDSIKNELYTPTEGKNDLGVNDSVTYMDPIGQYMEIKEIKNLLLFGKLYGITKAAQFNWTFNSDHMKAYGGKGPEEFKDGWYFGDDGATARAATSSDKPSWESGWVYRLGIETVNNFVPTLDIKKLSDPGAKEANTDYVMYRFDVGETQRRELMMNPAFGTKVPAGVSYNANGNHLKTPGVFTLSDLRIWTEDTGDFNDEFGEGSGIESNLGYDQALWVNIPINMLPLRTVTITQQNNDDGSIDWLYDTNCDKDDTGYSASFPFRLFYTVGMAEELLNEERDINLSNISNEYFTNNKVTTDAAVEARGLPTGSLEFFSNWYDPTNRYTDYSTKSTDYTYGDPVSTFSPSSDNQYYIFQKSYPLYSKAYVWVANDPKAAGSSTSDGSWKLVQLEEEYTGEETRTFDPAKFSGKCVAEDLTPVLPSSDDPQALEKLQTNMWTALNAQGVKSVNDGDLILLKNHRLTDVDRPDDGKPDPFSSEGYYYLPIEYFEKGEDGYAHMQTYVVARKGSEFGSGYKASGITNGDMLCWYDMSGNYSETYAYLSFSETGDKTRGKAYIGHNMSTDEIHHPDESILSDPEFINLHKEMMEKGEWVVSAKQGGLRCGNLAQSIGTKTDGKGNALSYYPEEYINSRFPGSDPEMNWVYYAGNRTRTANNYYLPTISTASNVHDKDIIVNAYLGNNGRLAVEDTLLLMTKRVEGESIPGVDLTKKEFDYQIFVDGMTGSNQAVKVEFDQNANLWRRRISTIDILTDNACLLKYADDSYAAVDEKGAKIGKSALDNKFYYFGSDGSLLTGDGKEVPEDKIYYMYIGENSVEMGDTNSFRLYSAPENGEELDRSSTYVYTEDDATHSVGDIDFRRNIVRLIPYSEVEDASTQDNGDGTFGWRFKSENSDKYSTLSDFVIATLNIGADYGLRSETSIITDFAIKTQYLTIDLYFGADGDGKPAYTEKDLYDPTPFRVGGTLVTPKPENVAKVTLRKDEGLVFNGIKNTTVYRITERMDVDYELGYTIDSVNHVVSSSYNHYVVGNDTIPLNTTSGGDNGDAGLQGYYQFRNNPDGTITKPVAPAQVSAVTNTAYFNDGEKYYSVFGNTGEYEEAVHYTNTFISGSVEIWKEVDAEYGTELTAEDRERSFNFEINLTVPAEMADAVASSNCELYKRSGNGWELEKTFTTDFVKEDGNVLKTAFALKAGEKIIIKDLPMGTIYKYTVTEDKATGFKDQSAQEGIIDRDGGAVDSFIFVNIKENPDNLHLSLNARKNLTGGTLRLNQFGFSVTPDKGNPDGDPFKGEERIVRNNSDGVVNLFRDDGFGKAGTYFYTVKEVNELTPGIVFDESEYRIKVVIEETYESGEYTGKLKATVWKVGADGTETQIAATGENIYNTDIVFENEITPTGNVAVRKTVTGSDGRDGNEFSFRIIFTSEEELDAVSGFITTKDGDVKPVDLNLAKQLDGSYACTFKISDLQTMTFVNLPLGTNYSVREITDDLTNRYVLRSRVRDTGTVTLNGTRRADFENAPYIALPGMGGIGEVPAYLIGALLLVAGVYLLIVKTRQNQYEKLLIRRLSKKDKS